MKKIYIIVLLLVCGFFAMGQYPVTQSLGSDSALVTSKGGLKGRIINWAFTDTTQANTQRIKQYPGAQIFTTSDTSLWLRTPQANRWVKSSAGSGTVSSLTWVTDSSLVICYGDGTCDTIPVYNFGDVINQFVANNFDTSQFYFDSTCMCWKIDSSQISIDINNFTYVNDSTLIICFTNNVCDTISMYNFDTVVSNIITTYIDSSQHLQQVFQNFLDSSTTITNIVGCNYIYPQGLLVSWSGNLLDFDVTAGTANINCNAYNYAEATVTLSPGDATYDRFDVIAVDTNNTVIVIEGTPAADPQIPQVDPASQLSLTTVLVAALATTPTDIIQTVLWDENLGNPTEWDFTTNAWTNSVPADPNDVSNPYHLTKDIAVSNTGTVSLLGAYIRFDAPDTLLVSTGYSLLKAYVKLNFSFNPNQGLRFTWMFGGSPVSNTVSIINGVLGFDRTNTTTYQNLTIPFGLFVFTDTAFDQLLIQPINSSKGFLLDYIQLQEGLSGSDNFGNFINNQEQEFQLANYKISGNGTVQGQLSSPVVGRDRAEKFGKNATSSASYTTTIGYGASTNANEAVSVGFLANGSGINIGYLSNTSHRSDIAIGGTATGTGITQIGRDGYGTANDVVSIGTSAVVSGTRGIGIGELASITHSNTIGLGYSVASTRTNEFILPSSITSLEMRGLTRNVAGYVLTDSLGTGEYWVARPVSGGITTADNGLTANTATNVQLGATNISGSLFTSDRYINTDASTLFIVGQASGSYITIDVVSDQGTAILAESTTGTSIWAQSGSKAILAEAIDLSIDALLVGSQNTTSEVIRVRKETDGSPANGIGGSIDFRTETSTVTELANQLISKWTDVTNATRTSQFIINGVNSGSTGDIAYFNGNGMVGIGDATASATRLNVVDNSVGAASIVNISSTSTAAASGLQKGINVSLSGANSNSGQTTYGIYSSNTHTGTLSTNIGGYFSASGGSTNIGAYGTATTYGLYGVTTSNGVGVYGSASNASGFGVWAENTTSGGIGILGYSNNGYGGYFRTDRPSLTNNVLGTVAVVSTSAGGAGTNGIGGSIVYLTATSSGGSSVQPSNTLISSWTDATNATRTSQFIITGVNSSVTGDIISFEGNKRTMLYGRLEMQQGADVASVAGAIAVGLDGNVFELTGTNAVTLISNLNFVNGSVIYILFTSTATLTDGTANSGTDIGMELAGNANFTGSADDVICLVLSEIGSVQKWREVSRSVN